MGYICRILNSASCTGPYEMEFFIRGGYVPLWACGTLSIRAEWRVCYGEAGGISAAAVIPRALHVRAAAAAFAYTSARAREWSWENGAWIVDGGKFGGFGGLV